jgi:hypothetical protein
MRPTDAAACVIEPSLNRARDHSPLQHPQAQALQRSQPIDIDEFTHPKAGRAKKMDDIEKIATDATHFMMSPSQSKRRLFC